MIWLRKVPATWVFVNSRCCHVDPWPPKIAIRHGCFCFLPIYTILTVLTWSDYNEALHERGMGVACLLLSYWVTFRLPCAMVRSDAVPLRGWAGVSNAALPFCLRLLLSSYVARVHWQAVWTVSSRVRQYIELGYPGQGVIFILSWWTEMAGTFTTLLRIFIGKLTNQDFFSFNNLPCVCSWLCKTIEGKTANKGCIFGAGSWMIFVIAKGWWSIFVKFIQNTISHFKL